MLFSILSTVSAVLKWWQRGICVSVLPAGAHGRTVPDLRSPWLHRYADCCLQTALRLGMPRLPHPSATRLGPGERLRIAYVSSDFGNHPLSHLMASVFGGHDRSRIEVRRHAVWGQDQG